MSLEYEKENIPKARSLRRNLTPWENRLWYQFLRGYRIRFQRQKAIGAYIVDFFCAQARLAVELDGGGHYEPEKQAYDARRTAELKGLGVTVLRFCNTDVDRNFRAVCEEIDRKVRELAPDAKPTKRAREATFL